MNLFEYFLDDEQFSIKDATNLVKNIKNMNVNDESIRARIYEGVEKGIFTKISRGVYKVSRQIEGKENTCLLINGDGRDLSTIKDKSIDGIITDHPYDLQKALTGGNRKFATFELFRYENKDFKEKQRVLKEGAFLVEFLPEESEVNFDYLYEIKKMAQQNGFKYVAKVAWKKGDFIANTGRKSKNTEDVMIFSNGEPRNLKLDAKKNLAVANENNLEIKGKSSYEIRDMLQENNLPVHYMKGTNGMLPTVFDYQPKNSKDKIMEAEKPVELIEEIIEYISKPYETLLDQFAGSGNFVIACYNKQRNAVAIEKDKEMFGKMKNNIENNLNIKFNELDTMTKMKEDNLENNNKKPILNFDNITEIRKFITKNESGLYTGKNVEGQEVRVWLEKAKGMKVEVLNSKNYWEWNEYDESGFLVGQGVDPYKELEDDNEKIIKIGFDCEECSKQGNIITGKGCVYYYANESDYDKCKEDGIADFRFKYDISKSEIYDVECDNEDAKNRVEMDEDNFIDNLKNNLLPELEKDSKKDKDITDDIF